MVKMSDKSIWKYRWYDTPNNEDGLKKALYLGKHATRVGLCLGLTDALVFDTSRSNLQKALRVGAWVVPLVGMSTAFTVTQQVSLKVFPSLDQKFAFMFGGVAAAGVLGSWFRNGQMAFSASLIFGGAAFAYQYMREYRNKWKGTRYEEIYTFIPDDHEYISYERHQSCIFFANTYDFRPRHTERGGEVHNIG